MTVTNQDGVARSHDDEIVHSKQRDSCPLLIENNVVTGINRRDPAVSGVSMLIVFEIISNCSPAPDIVPIEAGFDNKNAIRFLHDCVIEGDPRQFTETLAQYSFKVAGRAKLGNEIRQLRRMAIELAQHCRHRPDEHSGVPTKVAFPQK